MNRAYYRTRTKPQNFQSSPGIDHRYPLVRRIDEISERFEQATAHIESVDPLDNMRRWRDGIKIAMRRDNDRMYRHIRRMRRIREVRNAI